MGLSFPPFTRAVKQLLIANGVVYLVVALLGVFTEGGERWVQLHFGLVPALVVFRVWIWQLVTYAFLHDGLLHIFFNMLALWMFGAQLEQDWGYNIFMQFYFFCAVGAALTTVVVSFTGLLGANPLVPTVGASGAIFGLLLAFGILYAESEIMLFPIPFMIKAKYFIIGLIFIEVALMLGRRIGRASPSPTWRTWAAALRIHLVEVHTAARLRPRSVGTRLRSAQFVLPLEEKARCAQVRSLHAQARRSRRLQARRLLRRVRQLPRPQRPRRPQEEWRLTADRG